MALKATIGKLTLQITDLDRNYYQEHSLTIAQHPSETDARMVFRILAYALNATDRLCFTKGISTDDEPDLWQKSYTDEIDLWIDLGQPDEKRIRKACGRAEKVIIYTYKNRSAPVWWEQMQNKLERFNNLAVIHLNTEDHALLGKLVKRNMQLQCMVQDGKIWISDELQNIEVDINVLK